MHTQRACLYYTSVDVALGRQKQENRPMAEACTMAMKRAATKRFSLNMVVWVVFRLGGWCPRKESALPFISFLSFPARVRSPVSDTPRVRSDLRCNTKVGTRTSFFVGDSPRRRFSSDHRPSPFSRGLVYPPSSTRRSPSPSSSVLCDALPRLSQKYHQPRVPLWVFLGHSLKTRCIS